MQSRVSKHLQTRFSWSSTGFTLVELVIATLISTLVIGIISVALGFTLRLWERQQNRKVPEMFGVVDLMKWQLANFDPITVRLDGETLPLFLGEEHSMAMTTDHSVKAISKGGPVVARYQYVSAERKLYYAEMPLDPYDPKKIREFLQMKPGNEKSWPRFYPTRVEKFSLSYAGEGESSLVESWGDETAVPAAVVVKWSSEEDPVEHTHVMIPNSLFPKPLKEGQQEKQGQSLSDM